MGVGVGVGVVGCVWVCGWVGGCGVGVWVGGGGGGGGGHSCARATARRMLRYAGIEPRSAMRQLESTVNNRPAREVGEGRAVRRGRQGRAAAAGAKLQAAAARRRQHSSDSPCRRVLRATVAVPPVAGDHGGGVAHGGDVGAVAEAGAAGGWRRGAERRCTRVSRAGRAGGGQTAAGLAQHAPAAVQAQQLRTGRQAGRHDQTGGCAAQPKLAHLQSGALSAVPVPGMG